MPFPVSYGFSVKLPAGTRAKSCLARIEACLNDWEASQIKVEKEEISFKVNFFRLVWNWNMLVPVNSGRFSVEKVGKETRLRVQLSYLRMCILTALFIFGVLWQVVKSIEHFPQENKMLILFGFWVWLFGIHYLVSIVRFHTWAGRFALSNPD